MERPILSNIQDLPDYLARCLSNALIGAGIDTALTIEIIEVVDGDIRREFGGSELYVPVIDKGRRNAAILSDWRSKVEKDQIARDHGVSVSTVNRVISAYLNRHRRSAAVGFGRADWNL